MLASVSGALANQGINIANLSLGRTTKGENAITAVSVDKNLSDEELKPILDLEGIRALQYISLSAN